MSLLWWLFGYYAAKDIGNAIDEDARASYEDGYQNGYDDALSELEEDDADEFNDDKDEWDEDDNY